MTGSAIAACRLGNGYLTCVPGRFSRLEAALHHVGDLSVRYKI